MAERPEDLNLPTSIVTKIIKDCLPSTCKVSKEANAAIAKAASVFILYTTSSSNGIAQKSNRKTISGQDVISAMGEMEFDKFVRPLENTLAMWKKSQQEKKDSKKASAAAAKPKEKKTENENNEDSDVQEVEPEPEKEKEPAAE